MLTISLFFDGTGNNRFNSAANRKGDEFKRSYDREISSVSYRNYYSNIALLYFSLKEKPGQHEKIYIEGAGTLVLHKIDSRVAQKIAGKIKNGSVPDIKIVSKLTDPDVNGAERIELTGVTLDELTHGFENKKVQEESYPFKFADYNYLDLIL